MSTLADDVAATPAARLASGLGLAIVSATAFGLSGPLAKALIESGWTAGGAVVARVSIAAAVLIVPAFVALGGRWHLIRANRGLLAAYGFIAIGGCQLAYFNAVGHMQVGVAILIEFTSPVVVIGWMWFRHAQRPSRLTVGGAVLALAGLVLVLNLTSGADVDAVGIVWALGAMAGAAFYWIISADDGNGLPGIVLAAGGLLVAAVTLGVAGVIGIVPVTMSTDDVMLAGSQIPWWIPMAALGVVTAGFAYVVGIVASRRLGPRLAAFVGLTEAVASVVLAWLLLDEAPAAIQLAGGALILIGVIAVRLGEPRVAALVDVSP